MLTFSVENFGCEEAFFLSELNSHLQHLNLMGTHRNIFINKVIRCYVTLRLKHDAKLKNENLHK